MPLRYLFIDMNAYFASVEQQFRPELRGQPVGVVPTRAETTCCIAASYEAKRHGVKTGTSVRDARRLCPGMRFVEARHRLYVVIHEQIVEAVQSCVPVQHVLSIDEMACKLIGQERELPRAKQLALEIKESIRKRVGEMLRCSIGIAPNIMLSKLAADMQKPDGLVLLPSESLPQSLYACKLDDFSGIGPRMLKRLQRVGIRSVQQLCALSPRQLGEVWGSPLLGMEWWSRLHGEDAPLKATARRTVSHSHVLPPALRHEEGACAVTVRLLHKAAARLRHLGYHARKLTLSIKYLGGGPTWHSAQRMLPCQDTLTLLATLRPLWLGKPHGRILRVGVWLSDLVAQRNQARSLFPDDRHHLELSQVMDRINQRFGAHTVYFGGMFGTQHHAPTRIAFTQIPNLDLADP